MWEQQFSSLRHVGVYFHNQFSLMDNYMFKRNFFQTTFIDNQSYKINLITAKTLNFGGNKIIWKAIKWNKKKTNKIACLQEARPSKTPSWL